MLSRFFAGYVLKQNPTLQILNSLFVTGSKRSAELSEVLDFLKMIL